MLKSWKKSERTCPICERTRTGPEAGFAPFFSGAGGVRRSAFGRGVSHFSQNEKISRLWWWQFGHSIVVDIVRLALKGGKVTSVEM